MDNVIQFPKAKNNAPPQSIEEMVGNIEHIRREHINELITSMIPQIVNVFMANGVDIDQEPYIKDVSMIIESSKSLLYKYYGVEHPFHEMIEEVFDFHFNEDETIGYTFDLNDKLEEE